MRFVEPPPNSRPTTLRHKTTPNTGVICVLSPYGDDRSSPQGGVAAYTRQLLQYIPSDKQIVALTQLDSHQQTCGSVAIEPTWNPDWRFLWRLARALRIYKPDLLHIQHEFRIFGGLLRTASIVSSLRVIRPSDTAVVITLHSAIGRRDITPSFLQRNRLRIPTRLAYWGIRFALGEIRRASDQIIVHHAYFKDILITEYRYNPSHVHVIPIGATVNDGAEVQRHATSKQKNVLVFGFLTTYKYPELVLQLAQHTDSGDVNFWFAVGENPRDESTEHQCRLRDLRTGVEALGDHGRWLGFVPDAQLDALFAMTDAVILPYIECISVSAVAALAVKHRVPICHSVALRPLFGTGPLEFNLDEQSLQQAVNAALDGVLGSDTIAGRLYAPLDEVGAMTAKVWEMACSARGTTH
ncbi:MAG: glycosyltransferase [Acidimicrobiales bacterium]